MRLGARLTSTKLTALPRSSTTSRTRDSEYLFWAKFFFHGGKIVPQNQVQEWSILNSYGNYLQGIVDSQSAMQTFGNCPNVICKARSIAGVTLRLE